MSGIRQRLVLWAAITAAATAAPLPWPGLDAAVIPTPGAVVPGSAPTVASQQRSRADLFRALLEFRARDMQGRDWTHERLQGRIVLVDFWATWCAPCLAELPYLKRARQRYGEDFEVLGVSLDTMSRRRLVSWLQRQAVDWPQIHQDRGYEDRLPVAFGIDRLPSNLLLDRHGRLRAVDVRGERLFVEVERLLQEERAADETGAAIDGALSPAPTAAQE